MSYPLPEISHPNNQPNFTRVKVHDLTLWYSYETCVAFHTPADGLHVRENEWGPTTGKHLTLIDGGNVDRVDAATFQQRLHEALA